LTELASGPYQILATRLDERDLCRTDATCRLIRNSNLAAWRALGISSFCGLELERKGIFDFSANEACHTQGAKRPRIDWKCVDWKSRFRSFWEEVLRFRGEFDGVQINEVRDPDAVAFLKFFLRTDILENDCGVYIEVEVLKNADTASLSIVDFDEGGESSVTFSPEHGVVIRERKVQKTPCITKGAYVKPLSPRPGKFEGHMGLYLRDDRVAFFRRFKGEAG